MKAQRTLDTFCFRLIGVDKRVGGCVVEPLLSSPHKATIKMKFLFFLTNKLPGYQINLHACPPSGIRHVRASEPEAYAWSGKPECRPHQPKSPPSSPEIAEEGFYF